MEWTYIHLNAIALQEPVKSKKIAMNPPPSQRIFDREDRLAELARQAAVGYRKRQEHATWFDIPEEPKNIALFALFRDAETQYLHHKTNPALRNNPRNTGNIEELRESYVRRLAEASQEFRESKKQTEAQHGIGGPYVQTPFNIYRDRAQELVAGIDRIIAQELCSGPGPARA